MHKVIPSVAFSKSQSGRVPANLHNAGVVLGAVEYVILPFRAMAAGLKVCKFPSAPRAF